MIIPFAALDDSVLANILQDIATRDGTDYGDFEATSEQKIAQLKMALQQGMCFLVYESLSETIGVMNKEDASRSGLL